MRGVYGTPSGYPPAAPSGYPPPGLAEVGPGSGRSRRSRKPLIIGLVLAGVLVLLAAVAFTVTTAFDKSSSFAIGSCVKQEGKKAKEVGCDTAGAFKVVAKEDAPDNCPDSGQPYVELVRSGKKQYLCLSPAGKK
jgi:hypothetical protein